MRLFALAIAVLLLGSACTLSNQPVTPTSPPIVAITSEALTPAASVTPLPGVAPTSASSTRTPFGSTIPTTQPLVPTSSFPTPASGERADITSPANGATVSGSPLYVSGIVHNLSQDQFTLQVFDATGQPLTGGQAITLNNPNHVADVPWSASVMVGSYTGTAQVRIMTRIADGTDAVIGAANVTITPAVPGAPQPNTGSTGVSITSPTNGSGVSGDPITVTGTAGGLVDNQLTLLLLDSSGTILNSQLITLTGAEQTTVPWSATMGTSGYRGRVEIRAVTIRDGQQVTLGSVTVTLQ